MKTSNIKSEYSPEQAGNLPVIAGEIKPSSLVRLTEGHFSQAFSYETNAGEKRVLRLGRKAKSFYADRYAHEHFNMPGLPIPEVLDIGEAEQGLYFCISRYAPGVPSDQLQAADFSQVRETIEESFARIFTADISDSNGYRNIDFDTGNGAVASYRPESYMAEINLARLREKCSQHDIDPALVDAFARNLDANFPKLDFDRRLTHGDLGFDNVLVDEGRVTAVIDWSSVGYGDWLHDYSRLEFWYPGRHTPAMEFAQKYGLDTRNFQERWLTHTADHALSTLGYIFKYEDEGTARWVRENLASKLDCSEVK